MNDSWSQIRNIFKMNLVLLLPHPLQRNQTTLVTIRNNVTFIQGEKEGAVLRQLQ